MTINRLLKTLLNVKGATVDDAGKSALDKFFAMLTPEQRASIAVVTGDGARWITAVYIPDNALYRHLKTSFAKYRGSIGFSIRLDCAINI